MIWYNQAAITADLRLLVRLSGDIIVKVLITTDCYDPEINGVVVSLKNLRKGLEKAGHTVKILTLAPGLHDEKKGDVYYIASFSVAIVYPYARIAVLKKKGLIRELIEWKPDVLHSQSETSTFWCAKRIAEATGAPIIQTCHTIYEEYTHYFCPSKTLYRKMAVFYYGHLMKDVRYMVAPTQKMAGIISSYRIKCPLAVIPGGIDTESWHRIKADCRRQIRSRYLIADDECLILYVGRLAEEKNVHELIDYLSAGDMENMKFMIVGDGPIRKALEDKCMKNGISHKTVFTGMVSPKTVSEYYHAADIFVNASTSESQGLTYLEAMASGLPVLCRYDPCLDGVVIHGKTGYVYRNRDEFFRVLKMLSENKDQRLAIGTCAKATADERFSLESCVRSCEDLYWKCIAPE